MTAVTRRFFKSPSRMQVRPPVSAAAGATPLHPDTRLLALWKEWQIHYLAWTHAHDDEDALWPKWPGYLASREESDAYVAAYTALRETPEYKDAERRTRQAWDKVWAIECAMAEGDAKGLPDILVRARVVSSWTCVNRNDEDVCLLVALRRDLERMAAAAGSIPEMNESVALRCQCVEHVARSQRERKEA